jgi:hypothetical protein
MRMPALILIVMAAALPMTPASPQEKGNPPFEELPPPEGLRPVKKQIAEPAKKQIEEPAKTVKELQKERIATLKQMADITTQMFQRGNVRSFEEVLEARLLVLEAELDAAEKESDRITLYKNIVDVLKEYETIADKMVKIAKGTQASVLKVKARRLEAEINLERAKAKAAKEAK